MRRGEKYIVDGQVMSIIQVKRGHYTPYWRGVYKAVNGTWQYRYFGAEDPRPQYPRFIAPTGLMWLYGLGRWQRG